MTSRRTSLIAISIIGVAHSVIALGYWIFLLAWLCPAAGVNPLQLPPRSLIESFLFPLSNCIIPLIAFCVSLRLSLQQRRLAEFSLGITILYVVAAFLIDTEKSFAQIHNFGEPGTNHFFASWPVYSEMPYLSSKVRFVIAGLTVVASIAVLWRCRWQFREQSKSRST